jgi:pimeloyl-ACP methyl ester carboxylesterase
MTLQEALMRCVPERTLVESLPGFFRHRYPELVEPALQAARQTGKRKLLAATHAVRQRDWRPILPTIRVPTLVLCGSKDRFNLPAARSMSRAIPGAELRIVPQVSHIWNLQQPELFTTTVLEFVQRTETGGSPLPRIGIKIKTPSSRTKQITAPAGALSYFTCTRS